MAGAGSARSFRRESAAESREDTPRKTCNKKRKGAAAAPQGARTGGHRGEPRVGDRLRRRGRLPPDEVPVGHLDVHHGVGGWGRPVPGDEMELSRPAVAEDGDGDVLEEARGRVDDERGRLGAAGEGENCERWNRGVDRHAEDRASELRREEGRKGTGAGGGKRAFMSTTTESPPAS